MQRNQSEPEEKFHAQRGKAFSCFQLVENCMMQLFLANHLNPPFKSDVSSHFVPRGVFFVRWFSENTKSNKLFKAPTEIRGTKSPFGVILYFKHSLSSLTQNPSFENNALTRTQKQSAKPRKCSSLPKRKQLTTLATSRTSLLILSLILNFYLIILFTEWPAQSLRSLVRIIARG